MFISTSSGTDIGGEVYAQHGQIYGSILSVVGERLKSLLDEL